MDEISPSVVSSDLNKSIGGFAVQMEDRVFVFEVELLAFDDNWPRVD